MILLTLAVAAVAILARLHHGGIDIVSGSETTTRGRP